MGKYGTANLIDMARAPLRNGKGPIDGRRFDGVHWFGVFLYPDGAIMICVPKFYKGRNARYYYNHSLVCPRMISMMEQIGKGKGMTTRVYLPARLEEVSCPNCQLSVQNCRCGIRHQRNSASRFLAEAEDQYLLVRSLPRRLSGSSPARPGR